MNIIKFTVALHLVLPFSAQCFADPINAYEGFLFESDQTSVIILWCTPSGKTSVEYAALDGGMKISSYVKESAKGALGGEINLRGNPVSVVLATDKDDEAMGGNGDYGVFNIWKRSKYGSTNPTARPLLEVESVNGKATFDSINVSVNNGSLSVGGSPVLTSAGFGAALSASAPPVTFAWQVTYVGRGNVSNGGLLATCDAAALGLSSIALGSIGNVTSGTYSYASGDLAMASGNYSSVSGGWSTTSGHYAKANGLYNTASDNYSTAWGAGNVTSGAVSTAMGANLRSQFYGQVVFGRYNKIDPSPSSDGWSAAGALFRLGNNTGIGTYDMSDAVTLINKPWKAGTSGPPEDPVATDDAGGEALVVDGHARLRGKVIIEQAQCDIGMGI